MRIPAAILSLVLLAGSARAQWTPVPPVNFSSLQLSQFADNELDVPYALYHFAQVANAVVENDVTEPGTGRFLPRGFLNIKVNREPVDNEPYNARIMEMQAALAYFYCADRPWNTYRGHPTVRVRLEAMFQRWSAMQNQPGSADGDKDGLFTEYSATGWGLAPTGFGVKNAAEALDLLHHSGLPFDTAVFEAAKTSLRRGLMALFTRPDMRSAARTYSNQFSGSYHAALIYLENWPDAELDAAFIQAVNDSATQDQSPSGFWYEQGGPDFGYSGVHEGNLKAALTRLRHRADLLPVVVDDDTDWNEWLAAMYVPQPGLATRTFVVNGGINTRTGHSSLTPRSRPYSEFVVPSRIFSLTDFEYAASLVTRRSQVQAEFGTWGPLAVPSSGSYSPGFVTNAMTPLDVWHPTAAQRDAAHASLPCLSQTSFNRLYRDALPLACTVAKRPTYYATASAGRIRVTRQVYGLGMLWNPSFGIALQSVSEDVNTNTWMFGTRRPGETRTYETYTTTASVTAAGDNVALNSGVTELPAGDLVLSYPLAAGTTTNGQKSIAMRDNQVEVSVIHSGSIIEVLPLAYASDGFLSINANTVTVARPNGSSLTIEVTSPDASISAAGTSGFITGLARRLVTITASENLTYRFILTGAPPGPANALNLDTHSGGTFQWPNDTVWNPDTTSGAGPLAADNIGIQGDLTGVTNLDYATGSSANRSISNIEVTDTNNASGSGAQINFRAGVTGSHLDFAITNPIIATNITNQNSGANRLTIENPRFQPGTVLTKGGSGNLRLNLLTASSVASFESNVTLLGAGGGLLWLSPGSAVPLALPDTDFGTFATSLVLSKGVFTAPNRLIALGSGRLSMGDGATLDLTGSSAISGGNLVLGSNNSGEFYLGGSATINMSGQSANFTRLNMGDQKNSGGSLTYNQLAGVTNISDTGFLGNLPSNTTATHTQNHALNVSGGSLSFTRATIDADFHVGRNARSASSGIVTLNSTVTLSNSGLLDLGPVTRMVICTDASANADHTAAALHLNGGTLVTAREIKRGDNTNAGGTDSAAVDLNGGTVRITGTIPELFDGFANNLLVSAGGLVIDTNGFDTAITTGLRENPASPGGGIAKHGSGVLTLTGTNTHTGATAVHGGTLVLGGGSALPDGAPVHLASGAALELAACETVGDLTGAGEVRLGPHTLTFGSEAVTLFSGGVSGTGSLIKQGGGPLTLSGSNTHSGNTTIRAGTLTLPTGATLTSAAPDATFTLADGTGNTTAIISGGTLAPARIRIGGPGASGSGLLQILDGSVATALDVEIAGEISGILDLPGGTLTTGNTSAVLLIPTGSGSAILNLRGGTLTTGRIEASPTGSSILNLNGGTLRASQSANPFLAGLSAVRVHASGVTIDTNGQDITIAQPLLAPAGNGIASIAVTGGTGYLTAPTVGISGGGGNGATASSTIDENFNLTSIVVTNPGSGYTTNPQVTLSGGGGTGATVGNITTAPNLSGGLTKTGAGTLTLAAPATYGGATTLTGGNLTLAGGADTLPIGTTLTINGNASLDLGGHSQTVAGLATGAGTYTATAGNGSLVVRGVPGNLNLTPPQTTNGQAVTLDLSGLSSFTADHSTRIFQAGGGGPYGNTLDLRLSASTNTITASSLAMNMGGSGPWPFNGATLRLGSNNTLNLGNGTGTCIALSGYRSSGNTITFLGSPASSSLRLRAADGKSRAGAIVVSNASSGTGSGQPITASFDLGLADVMAGEIILADTVQTGTGVSVTGTMTMAGGSLDVPGMTLGRVNTGGTPDNISTLKGSFTQDGGTARIATLTLGNVIAGGMQTSGTLPRFESTCTLGAGAVLEARTIQANPSGRAFRSTSVRTLRLNGGTLRNLVGGNLTVSGANTTGGALLQIVLGPSSNTIEATAGQTIDIQATAPVSGSGNLVKQGAGTLSLKGANSYAGETIIADGALEITNDDTLSDTHAIRLAIGGTLHLGFTGEDTVDRLFIDGVERSSGTWGGLTSGATHRSALFTGPGILLVSNGAAMENFDTWATDHGVTGGITGDSDLDGISNLVEYALDLNPAAADGAPGTWLGANLTFTKRPAAIANGDVSWMIETSDTLSGDSWIPAVTHPAGDATPTISVTLSPASGQRLFARLRITRVR
jgi:autotransporter-associated beta strand protein